LAPQDKKNEPIGAPSSFRIVGSHVPEALDVAMTVRMATIEAV
jgi:hypothetical protein